MKHDLLNIISDSLEKSNISDIRKDYSDLLSFVKKNKNKNIILGNGYSSVTKEYLIGEINQILETHTIERTKYYIKRLKKSLTAVSYTHLQ